MYWASECKKTAMWPGWADSKCLRSCVLGALRTPWQEPVQGESWPPAPCSEARSSLAGVSFERRSQGQLRPPERGGWGTRLSSHRGRPAPLSLRLGPAAPLGCGSALQPPAPRCGRGSWAGGRSGRGGKSGRRRQAAYTRLPVLHSEQPEPAAAATAPAAAATASASAAT